MVLDNVCSSCSLLYSNDEVSSHFILLCHVNLFQIYNDLKMCEQALWLKIQAG